MNYQVDANGFYGPYGGAYVPEILFGNVETLSRNYQEVLDDPDFQRELSGLLRLYVGRETPLYPSSYLSELHQANILLKREDLCHSGSHKINNTLGQILLARKLGKTRIVAETGAGSHGVATAMACALLKLPCFIYMGEVDMQRQFPNVERMRLLGATVIPALSGSKTLKDATNEAFRDWINNPSDTFYVIGSVVGPHPYPDMVAKLQSVISRELLQQVPELTGKTAPDYVVACVGGGSNAAGSFYHFLGNPDVKLIAAEAAGKGLDSGFTAAATFRGKTGILHGSKTKFMQTSEGQVLEAHSVSAGLDYPGIGPLHSWLHDTGRSEFIAVTDDEALAAGIQLSRMEGIIPAIESAHALAALSSINFNPHDVVVVCLSGRGDKDLETYIQYSTLKSNSHDLK